MSSCAQAWLIRAQRPLAVIILLAVWLSISSDFVAADPAPAEPGPPLRVVVSDPLAAELACDCVAGYAQRRYDALARFLQVQLKRPVKIIFTETLTSPLVKQAGGFDLAIGKYSEVLVDAKKIKADLRPVALLTDKKGLVTLQGLFVARADDKAARIMDLKGRSILFGPEDADEKNAAALNSLEAFGVTYPEGEVPKIVPSCSTAAMAVVDKEADIAVVSSYAMPLLEGCGTIDAGALKIIGRTNPVPFIGLFAVKNIDMTTEQALWKALQQVNKDPELLKLLESKDGFVPLHSPPRSHAKGKDGQIAKATWTDWRGNDRLAITPDVPDTLPESPRLLWSHTMVGAGMAGVTTDGRHLLVADKTYEENKDIFHCLDADTGRELWRIVYPASGEMDFTNSPRASAVIHDGFVYTLGAFGNLHCLNLIDGKVIWKKNIFLDFGAKTPTWGASSTPLIDGNRLIVNPGAKDASLVALDRHTGKTLWKSPGNPPGYSSFIIASPSGVRQIIGYDALTVGGWDPATGKRLWKLDPEYDGDFNVPTPIFHEGRLLLTTENNGTRFYEFDKKGIINPEPAAQNEDLAPDTSTPVLVNGKIFGAFGVLYCLDARKGKKLATLYDNDEMPFADYCSFIGGNDRVMIFSQGGQVTLIKADTDKMEVISQIELFADLPVTERDIWSHPVIVGNRLYMRTLSGVYCFLIDDK